MGYNLIECGLIKIMTNVDGSILPESFCPECNSILVPSPNEMETDPKFLKYICANCAYEVDKGQIDKVRSALRKR